MSFETDDKDDWGQPIPIPKSVKNNNDTEFKSKKLNSFKLIMIICFCLALISIIIYINTSDEKTLTTNSQSNSNVIVPKNNEFTTFTLHLIKKGKVEYNIDFTETLTNISKSKFNKVTETCMKAFNNSNDNVCFNLLKSLKTQ